MVIFDLFSNKVSLPERGVQRATMLICDIIPQSADGNRQVSIGHNNNISLFALVRGEVIPFDYTILQ